MSDLFRDWAAVARKAKRVPSINDQSMHGEYSARPFLSRFGGWKNVAEGMRSFAESSGLDKKHPALMEMIAQWSPRGAVRRRAVERGVDGEPLGQKPRLLPDRPVYGRPLTPPGLAHEPVNEMGAVYLFGLLGHRMGYVVTRIQSEFPDCEAFREVAPGRWQRVRIEFEFESHWPSYCSEYGAQPKCMVRFIQAVQPGIVLDQAFRTRDPSSTFGRSAFPDIKILLI